MPMITSRYRRGLATMTVLTSLLLSQQAAAMCYIRPEFTPEDVKMDMGQVVILPSTPVGGVIKTLIAPIIGGYSTRCDANQGGYAYARYVNAKQQAAVSGHKNVYATDIEGVGVRVFRNSGSVRHYYPDYLSLPANASGYLEPGNFIVELVKTAARTGSGRIAPNGRFTTFFNDGDGPSKPMLTSTFSGSGTTVVSPTCEVQAGSRNIAVDFGSVPNTRFTGVGSTAANRDFDIHLNCQGGSLAELQSTVGIRLDADQDSSNMPGVLKLNTLADSATRIGIQLVQRDSSGEREVRFGQTINIGKTTVGSSTLTLPLRARYIQTLAGTVGAGTANAQATFTISYE